MKLYTENQVNELRRALRDIAQWNEDLEDDWEDAGNRAMDALRCFDKLTQIELPSDEEIDESSLKWFMTANKREIIFDLGWMKIFKAGAKCVIDKIQGGKK